MKTLRLDRLRKIDSHVHIIDRRLQKKPTTKPFLEESFDKHLLGDIISSSKKSRILKSIVFPLPSENYSSRLLNREVLEASKANPHIVPIAFIPKKASGKEVRLYKKQGFKGFKIYSDILEELAHALTEARLPVILHPPLSPSSPEFKSLIARIADKFPVVLAHFGRGYTQQEAIDLIRLITPHSNIYVDTSAYVGQKRSVEYVIRSLGPNRVLFGSDRPFSYLAGTNLRLSKKYGAIVPPHLVGQNKFLTNKDYRWNTPELKAIFNALHLPKQEIGQKSEAVLQEVLSKLLRQGIITQKDVNKIFFSNARRVFNI